jgi:predicted nucleic acid-binding protein
MKYFYENSKFNRDMDYKEWVDYYSSAWDIPHGFVTIVSGNNPQTNRYLINFDKVYIPQKYFSDVIIKETMYTNHGLNLSTNQMEKIVRAARNDKPVSIRLLKVNLRGDHMLPLTTMQINKIDKGQPHNISLSKKQLAEIKRKVNETERKVNEVKIHTGGILPLLPLIFGAIGAAGAAAGGAKAIHGIVAERRAGAEQERHNKQMEDIERMKKVGEIDGHGLFLEVPQSGHGLYLHRPPSYYGTGLKKTSKRS